MRAITKVLATVTAVGLVASTAACSSSKDTKPVGSFSKLTAGSTTVALAPSFLSALTSLMVTPGTEGNANIETAGSTTSISFPITGGTATIYKKGAVTPYVQGKILHDGSGLTLTAGTTTMTTVTLKDFVINPGTDSNLTGEVDVTKGTAAPVVFAKSARLFDLDGSTLKTPTISGGVATLTGTTVYLSATAASALNMVFGLTGSKALAGNKKVEIGIATILAKGV